MNVATPIRTEKSIGHTVCPHDCPSACALEVDLTAEGRIGRVRGSAANTYTAGVICAKVARYSERIYHPGRLMVPQRRVGAKGEGRWQEVSWEAALDEIADAFVKAEQLHGSEAVWPYFYAGTMGQVQRDSIERLRRETKARRNLHPLDANEHAEPKGLSTDEVDLRRPDLLKVQHVAATHSRSLSVF